MSIRCRNGGTPHTHETVDEVRACYAGSGLPTRPADSPAGITDKQREFLEKLMSERGLTADVSVLTKRQASDEIDRLIKTVPKVQAKAPAQAKSKTSDWDAIPEGHYAVTSLTGNNDLDFFRVDKPTEGTWKGYVFVKRVIGGRPSVPVRGSTREQARRRILEAGPADAARRYGQELGQCSRCNRHLTDQVSRELGMGPECRARAA